MTRDHLLELMVIKLTQLNKDDLESRLDFDKLLDDTEPLIIKAAKDDVAHRYNSHMTYPHRIV